MRIKLIIGLCLFGLFASAQTPMVNNIPWYEYSKKLSVGKLMVKNAGEYDTSFTIPSINAWITLDTIAADKTVTFAAGASTDAGVLCFVYNANSSAFTWNVSGSVIDASDGTSISTLGRGLHTFIWTGSRWARQSSGSGSGGTPDPYTGGYGILVDAITKVISLDSANLHQDLELKKLGDSMWFEVDGVAGTKVRVPDFSKTTTDSLLSTSLNSYWYYGGIGGLATSQEGTTANRPTLVTDVTRLRWNEDSSRFEVGDLTDGWRGLAYTNELGTSGASDWNGLIESSRPFTTNETISGTYYNQYYFTGGSPSTLTLPSIASSANRTFFIKNQGGATLTVASAGSNEIFTTSLVSSFTMAVGAGYIVINDGDYWNVYAQGSGSGSVTSVATGYGLSGGPITSTGTITADTSNQLASKLRLYKIVDSLAIALAPNLSVYNAGSSGARAIFVNADTVWGKRMIGGSGITITENADSTLTFAASGGTSWAQDGNTVGAEKWLGTVDNFSLPIRTNNTQRAIYTNGGNYYFKTTSPLGNSYGYSINDTTAALAFKVGSWPIAGAGIVNNALIAVRGAGTSSSTYPFAAYNSSTTLLFALRDDGQVTLNNTVITASAIRTGAGNYAFQPGNAASVSGYIHGMLLGTGSTLTSGNLDYEQFNYSFAPTSGTGTHTTINIKPTINQTGGASGKVRGIYFNPTNTASADLIAFEATAGRTIVQGVQTAFSAKTTTYTATAADHTVTGDATSAAFTITLPAASSDIKGRIYTFKKIDASANAVTIDGNASETIDGATTYALGTQWKYVSIQCDGTNWIIVANN